MMCETTLNIVLRMGTPPAVACPTLRTTVATAYAEDIVGAAKVVGRGRRRRLFAMRMVGLIGRWLNVRASQSDDRAAGGTTMDTCACGTAILPVLRV